jgi:hypothetical protein
LSLADLMRTTPQPSELGVCRERPTGIEPA